MKVFILLVSCITFLCSCGDKIVSPPEAVDTYEYFPLQIGDTWKYNGIGFLNQGDILTMTIDGTQEFNGKTYFRMTKSYKLSPALEAPDYFRIENDKVYMLIEKKDVLFIDFVNRDTTVGYVYSTEDSVVTKVGTFNKVKNVGWPASPVDGAPVNSYAPNIGLISSVIEGPSYTLIYAKIGNKIYQ